MLLWIVQDEDMEAALTKNHVAPHGFWGAGIDGSGGVKQSSVYVFPLYCISVLA